MGAYESHRTSLVDDLYPVMLQLPHLGKRLFRTFKLHHLSKALAAAATGESQDGAKRLSAWATVGGGVSGSYAW
jgi:hypothetical protein